MPKNDQLSPNIGIFGQFGPGLASSFGALLVVGFVVVARGLYLARHLFTLYFNVKKLEKYSKVPDEKIVKLNNFVIIHISTSRDQRKIAMC